MILEADALCAEILNVCDVLHEPLRSAELFDEESGRWLLLPHPMALARELAGAATMPRPQGPP